MRGFLSLTSTTFLKRYTRLKPDKSQFKFILFKTNKR